MSPVVIQKPPLWQRLRPVWGGFDGWLALAVLILACMGLVVMYSVGYDHGTRFTDHGRNMLLALFVLLLISQIPPQRLMLLAVPLIAFIRQQTMQDDQALRIRALEVKWVLRRRNFRMFGKTNTILGNKYGRQHEDYKRFFEQNS